MFTILNNNSANASVKLPQFTIGQDAYNVYLAFRHTPRFYEALYVLSSPSQARTDAAVFHVLDASKNELQAYPDRKKQSCAICQDYC